MAPRDAPSWQDQARGLRDAAEFLVGCAKARIGMHDADGNSLGTIAPKLARPLAQSLRASAELIEAHRHTLGLPVSYDLEVAGLLMGVDLGHNR